MIRAENTPPRSDVLWDASDGSAGASRSVEIRGKFIYAGEEKLYVRGATYGTFRPNSAGEDYPEPRVVDSDFAGMAAAGMNAVRTYTVPPRWLLDLALEHALRVMVGLPWEQHVAFLDDPGRADSIERRVREGVRACDGHPAVLCYAIGNEIPAPIVRWHGRKAIEAFLARLYDAAKDEDPDALVTYVNYPSTEYLELPFLDFACFNVYIEERESFEAYLARLHNLVGDRPIVMAEVGLDSRRNGEDAQAGMLEEQIRSIFAEGCAGVFAFSWTDEWYRGGFEIDDWDFGLLDRERRPKPALAAVSRAYERVPFREPHSTPSVSVVVCCYNAAETLSECLEGLARLEYPDYETIVVDDGSTDHTAEIARSHGVRLISIANQGLAHARNVGLSAARGELVAYIDGDAFPDPHWLHYVAEAFARPGNAAVGGPNIPPPDGPVAECVANAPGGPIHVLLSDREAEHIPGCNMVFRRAALEAVGGFDPQFHAAGDDVDICWRLQEQGWTLGFSPAAVVWHRRRNSVRGYWRQQKGYGKAEALLERKWPEKYNATGHVTWGGRIYGNGLASFLVRRRKRIRYGTWGGGLFQTAESIPSRWRVLPLMPEWCLLLMLLAAVSLLGLLWQPLLLAVPLLILATGAMVVQACVGAAHASFSRPRFHLHLLTALLYVLQPVARFWGRMRHGLTPWRRGRILFALPGARTVSVWSEQWRSPADRLSALEAQLRASGHPARRGGPFDRFELEVPGGLLGRARVRMAVEEHGGGKQLARFRVWPVVSTLGWVSVLGAAALTAAAALDNSRTVEPIFGAFTVVLVVRIFQELAATTAVILMAFERRQEGPDSDEAQDAPAPAAPASRWIGESRHQLTDQSTVPATD